MKENFTFDLAKLFRQACSVRRFSTIYTCKDENIAEHSFCVAELSAIIHSYMLKDPNVAKFATMINIKDVVYCSIFHDLDEVVTGDIPRPTKYSSKEVKSSIDTVVVRALKSLSDIFGDVVYNAKYEDVLTLIEARFLKNIDFLSVLYKALWEIDLGNLDMLDILPELDLYAKSLDDDVSKYIYATYMSPVVEILKKYKHTIPTNFRLK